MLCVLGFGSRKKKVQVPIHRDSALRNVERNRVLKKKLGFFARNLNMSVGFILSSESRILSYYLHRLMVRFATATVLLFLVHRAGSGLCR